MGTSAVQYGQVESLVSILLHSFLLEGLAKELARWEPLQPFYQSSKQSNSLAHSKRQ